MIQQKSDWERLIFLGVSVEPAGSDERNPENSGSNPERLTEHVCPVDAWDLGGIESGQYDKAIQRFLKVVHYDPGNLEAVLSLGEAYERTGRQIRRKNLVFSCKKTDKQPRVDRSDRRTVRIFKINAQRSKDRIY